MPPGASRVTPSHEFALTIQSMQVDNQLSNAAFPVMLCRHDSGANLTAMGTRTAQTGLLKAAQRQWEQQAQGPPMLELRMERLLPPSVLQQHDALVFLKCVSLPVHHLWACRQDVSKSDGSAAVMTAMMMPLCLSMIMTTVAARIDARHAADCMRNVVAHMLDVLCHVLSAAQMLPDTQPPTHHSVFAGRCTSP